MAWTRSPTKRLGQRPNLCLCLLCRPGLGKQEATILWNKFPLIWVCWSGAPVGRLLSSALPACPTDQPSLPFTVPTHGKTDEMSAGGGVGGAVGISALPWTAHVCSQQANAVPWRKELRGEELARDWSVLPVSLQSTTYSIVWIKHQNMFGFLPLNTHNKRTQWMVSQYLQERIYSHEKHLQRGTHRSPVIKDCV